jgi:arylsulfatase A-like enzyme
MNWLPRLLVALSMGAYCVIALPSASLAQGGSIAARPNIVLIVADDLGYGDLGCYGSQTIRTPNLDRLASDGLMLTSFCVPQPVCTASRAGLMSGCYPNRISLFGALNHQSNVGIAPEELLLPEVLKQRGYATAIFGKWHLGHREPFLPTRHGFDEFLGLPYSNDNGPLHPIVRDIPPLPLIEGDKAIEHDPDQSQFTRRFTDRAVAFIEKNWDKPFFVYLPHVMPHVPIFASEAYRNRSGNGLYTDVVEELDAGVGDVLATIDQLGLAEKTLVIFTSDNGPFLSYGNHAGSAGPLREGKLTTFEGGVRTPCIMRWKGKIAAGRTSNELVSSLDLLPTLSKLLEGPDPKAKIDGVDVGEFLFGKAEGSPRQSFLYYAGDELQAVRRGPWKLHLAHEYLTPATPPGKDGKPANFANLKPESMQQSGLRGIASRHGYIVQKIEQSLFNLESDVGESQDVAAEHPEVVAELLKLAEQARADLGDSLTGRHGAGVRPSGKL